jgi:hypothetical protein
MLPALIRAEHARAAPLGVDELTATLTGMLALIGGRMAADERTQWQIAIGMELQDIPADLTREALQHARRSCDHPSKVLPAIWQFVGDLPFRRRKSIERLELLASVGGVA